MSCQRRYQVERKQIPRCFHCVDGEGKAEALWFPHSPSPAFELPARGHRLFRSVVCPEPGTQILFLGHLAGRQSGCQIGVRKEFSTRSNWQRSYPPCDMEHELFAELNLGVP